MILLSGSCTAVFSGVRLCDAAVGSACEYPADGGTADAVEVGKCGLADRFFGVAATNGADLAVGEVWGFLFFVSGAGCACPGIGGVCGFLSGLTG